MESWTYTNLNVMGEIWAGDINLGLTSIWMVFKILRSIVAMNEHKEKI